MTRLARSFGVRRWFIGVLALWIGVAVVLLSEVATPSASAAEATVDLGTAAAYAVLGGQTVTNTEASVLSGDLGVSPGSAIKGFPPGKVHDGSIHAADKPAGQAQSDLTAAYLSAAGRKSTKSETNKNLGGQTLAAGVYNATSDMMLSSGTLTLDAHGDSSAVFIFQAGTTLTAATHTTVSLIDGAQACNVFWQVGSSATLKTGATFVGSILALTSASLGKGVSVNGRVLARNGAVTLIDDTISVSTCATSSTTTTTSASSATTTTSASSGTTTTTTATGVPFVPTGEPWAGWPYWTLAGLAGILGVASLERAVRIRRRRS